VTSILFAILRNRPKRQPPCADDRIPPFLADKRDSQEGAPIDSQITFANEVVAAMKNRMTEGRAVAAMRQGELSWRR